MLIEMSVRGDVAVRLLDKRCKYMEKTNSVVYRVMLHNFYTNMFNILKIYYSLLFLLLVHMHSLETMISMVDCILLSYF